MHAINASQRFGRLELAAPITQDAQGGILLSVKPSEKADFKYFPRSIVPGIQKNRLTLGHPIHFRFDHFQSQASGFQEAGLGYGVSYPRVTRTKPRQIGSASSFMHAVNQIKQFKAFFTLFDALNLLPTQRRLLDERLLPAYKWTLEEAQKRIPHQQQKLLDRVQKLSVRRAQIAALLKPLSAITPAGSKA